MIYMIYWEYIYIYYMELRNSTREEISMHSMALSWFQLTIRNVPNSFWRHFRPCSIHYVTISTFRFATLLSTFYETNAIMVRPKLSNVHSISKASHRILPTAAMWCSLIIRLQQFPELLFKLCGGSTSVVVLDGGTMRQRSKVSHQL